MVVVPYRNRSLPYPSCNPTAVLGRSRWEPEVAPSVLAGAALVPAYCGLDSTTLYASEAAEAELVQMLTTIYIYLNQIIDIFKL